MSTVKQEAKHNFVLTYKSPKDPGQDEVVEALGNLASFGAEEVLPGTIRVCGDPTSVAAASRPLRKWALAPEGRLSAKPPRRSILKSS